MDRIKKVLIIGAYPNRDNLKDGMIQRIKAIDSELTEVHKTYITFGNYSFSRKRINEYTEVVHAHYLYSYLKIRKVLKENYDVIYFHSIINFRWILPYNISSIKNKILDFHGAVPEEYRFLGGSMWKSRIWDKIEKRAINCCTAFVVVSRNMQHYYMKKYSGISHNFILKPIIPPQLNDNNVYNDVVKHLKEDLKLDDKPIILYSGNFQAWQNLDKMIEFIKHNKHKYNYIFLTGDIETLEKKLTSENLEKQNNIIRRSVDPKDLSKYYALANYGFLLRDENPLNYVAAPTKLVEYFAFGMTPIMLYDEIYDRQRFKYDYVSYNDAIDQNLKACKSERNISIYHKILETYQRHNIKLYLD